MLTAGDEQFLKGVDVIRKRSLITVAVVALILFGFVLLGWLRVGQTTLAPTVQRGSQVPELAVLLKASLLLFLATVLASTVGVVVLIASYARQTKKLLNIIEQLRRGELQASR